jgi:putative transposase
MTYWPLHYHLIWSTFDRQPMITVEREKVLYGVLHGKSAELNLKLHAIGNAADHVHIVVSIPPTLSVADCMRHLKGASAFSVNHMAGSDGQFKWQPGYGALTISDQSLETVKAYVARQKEHHRDRTTQASYESFDEDA